MLKNVILLLGLGLLGSGLSNIVASDVELPPKGKETTLNCLDFPSKSYKVLVPQEYDPTKPCAILYTFSPGGGGMIGAHKVSNDVTPTIIVGITGSKNGRAEIEYFGEVYAVMWDTLSRFNIDPGAQYAAGFSGGAVMSYNLARQYKERIGGIMASCGWLQMMVDPWFLYPKGLNVARTTGINDKGAVSYLESDMLHLNKAGCKVKDWKQPGGHAAGTPENIKAMMQWLISEKIADKMAVQAQEKADKWKENPYSPSAVKDILGIVKTAPRTKLGQLALLALFNMMNDEEKFSKISIPSSVTGPELTSFFGYMAYGAALANDPKRFRSAAFAFDKVCLDKNSKWGGILGAFYLFGSGEGIQDSKQGLELIKKYTKSNITHPYNQLVLSAALFKNNKKAEAQSVANKITAKSGDKKLTPVINDLNKALKGGEAGFDSKLWLMYFGEGD